MSLEQRRGLRLKSFLRNGTAADSSGRDAVRDVATATGSVTFKSTEPGKADGGTAPTPTARRVDSFSRLRRTPSELRRAEGFWSYLDDSALDRLDVCLSRKFFFLSFGLGEVRPLDTYVESCPSVLASALSARLCTVGSPVFAGSTRHDLWFPSCSYE
eukprot:scaffold7384_cov396-Prasinococcus_capsulatus_cf.AAC.11